MQSSPLSRWLSMAGTITIFTTVLGILACQQQSVTPSGNSAEAGHELTKTVAAFQQDGPLPIQLWGGSLQRNLVNLTEKNIATDWNTIEGKEKNLLWSAQLGSKAYGGPIVSGGKIFVGTNNQRPRDKAIRGDKGILMAFRESDGEFLWQLVHDKLAAGRVNDWPEEGICSSPVVEGNRLYYVNNRCEVVCATVDGKILWTLDMIKDLGVFPHNLATCSPLVLGDILFVVTANGVDEGHINMPAPNAPSFLGIDKKTGKVLWQQKPTNRLVMHGQWANPVFAEANGRKQIIFPAGDGYIYSFNPTDGELLWKFDCNPKGAVYRLGPKGTKNDFVNTPVIYDNKLYIAVGQDPEHKKGVGHLWCIDITKTPTNKDKDVSPWSDPKVEVPEKFDPKDPRNKDSALVWHFGGMDPTGERDYKFGRSLSTCAVHDGLCYACDFDGYFCCFDAQTGELYWSHELEQDTWSSPYWVDGHIYIGNEAGDMHIFKHSKKKELVRKIRMKGKIRVTPVAVNGVLYVMTENPTKLWAIKAK